MLKIVSFEDRLAHNDAFVVSFLAEHNLPFTMVPNFIEFAQCLAKDSKVIDKVKMSHHSAACKLREGLAPAIAEDLAQVLQSTYFNVDECFSNNH